MTLGAVLLEHLAEASKSGAGCLPDHHLRVGHTTLDERPQALQVRLDEHGASFDDDSKGGDGRLAHRGVGRGG